MTLPGFLKGTCSKAASGSSSSAAKASNSLQENNMYMFGTLKTDVTISF